MSVTESDQVVVELEAERRRLSRLTRMGIGMPIAGLAFWLVFAFLVARFKIDGAVVLAFFATGLVFPLGAGLARLLGGDLFAKSRTLTSLGLILAATVTVLLARGPAPLAVTLVAAGSYLVSILVIRAEVGAAMRGSGA